MLSKMNFVEQRIWLSVVGILRWGNIFGEFGVDDDDDDSRPSKCPKFYTNRILGDQNLRQKMRNFGQNLNCNKMTYLIKYTLTVQFSI